MTQAIAKKEEQAIDTQKRPIVMKNGLVHWVSDEAATKLQEHLTNQKAHSFIRLSELGITINSAEINGVYTHQQYLDLQKTKQGMWQCPEGNWHKRGEKECFCEEEKRKERREQERRAREQDENRPLTPEERERNKERTKKTSEMMVLSGTISHVGRPVRRTTLQEYLQAGNTLAVKEEDLKIEEDAI